MIYELESQDNYYNLKFLYNIYYWEARLQDQKSYLKKILSPQYKYQLICREGWVFLKYFLHQK